MRFEFITASGLEFIFLVTPFSKRSYHISLYICILISNMYKIIFNNHF